MVLELEHVSHLVGGQTHLYDIDLKLVPGAINVLLGPTQAGKTTLMRIMAGLDRPTSGRVRVDGKDVTGVGVRERNLAMVYQQFINYPAMSVFDNIASPLRLQRVAAAEIRRRVHEVAAKLHIDHLLDKRPGELSGGQQQRCALARALVKRASLVLLDEPLVNLDYKLREELRTELAALFADGQTTVVYATTEPQEALLLGGHTALVHGGRVLQHGETLAVYSTPASVDAAVVFNDPPMNLLPARFGDNGRLQLPFGVEVTLARDGLPAGECRIGIRPSQLRLAPVSGKAITVSCVLELAELSGSETYLHLNTRHGDTHLVAQLQGVHALALGSAVDVHIEPDELFVFGEDAQLASAPPGVIHGVH
ncbi:ABC transporter ATP-binding protein [Jeongeupia naejangsanensis]|uniref:ABC transporter ATP-binding protein n=1 Tax=Jeongeupia naejangsanensis TaxID=613195 RepID=A0ABS2BKV0_9NEIS|nr:ABC transporter ATP-binding protein [Jeongeupia naejangsanensis]MBM3116218.1 ABC transporter ATP-binding protein [Jeongeupia naejangsanensis]